MARLIATVIQWALFLGVSGGLVDATIAMRKEAARSSDFKPSVHLPNVENCVENRISARNRPSATPASRANTVNSAYPHEYRTNIIGISTQKINSGSRNESEALRARGFYRQPLQLAPTWRTGSIRCE